MTFWFFCRSRELVTDGLNKIKTVSCNLQQVEKERSDVSDQLCKANLQKEQLEKQVGKKLLSIASMPNVILN